MTPADVPPAPPPTALIVAILVPENIVDAPLVPIPPLPTVTVYDPPADSVIAPPGTYSLAEGGIKNPV